MQKLVVHLILCKYSLLEMYLLKLCFTLVYVEDLAVRIYPVRTDCNNTNVVVWMAYACTLLHCIKLTSVFRLSVAFAPENWRCNQSRPACHSTIASAPTHQRNRRSSFALCPTPSKTTRPPASVRSYCVAPRHRATFMVEGCLGAAPVRPCSSSQALQSIIHEQLFKGYCS